MKKISRLLILSALLFASCKKAIKTPAEADNVENVDYLQLNSVDELNQLIKLLPSFSEQDYTEWKKRNNNFVSLYDRSKKIQEKIESLYDKPNEIEKIMNKESSHFGLNKFGMVTIKSAGDLLAHFLNYNGVIKIGKNLMRYENGSFYSTATQYSKLASSEFVYDGDSRIKKMSIQEIKANTTNSRWSQYPWGLGTIFDTRYLVSQRFEANNRRFYVELIEEIIIGPVAYNNADNFTIGYSLYLKFGHQRRRLGVWSSTSSSTYIAEMNANAEYPQTFAQLPNVGTNVFQTINLQNVTLPSAQNQYYSFSVINNPVDWFGNAGMFQSLSIYQNPFIVNTSTFNPFFLRATADGGLPWFTVNYTTP